MLEFHRHKQAAATLLIHERQRSNSVLTISNDGAIERFLERPTDEERRGVESSWVFSGVLIFGPEFQDHLPATAPSDLPRDVFTRLAGSGKLFAFPLTGDRYAIDSPQRLADARTAVEQGKFKLRAGD